MVMATGEINFEVHFKFIAHLIRKKLDFTGSPLEIW